MPATLEYGEIGGKQGSSVSFPTAKAAALTADSLIRFFSGEAGHWVRDMTVTRTSPHTAWQSATHHVAVTYKP